MNIEGHIELDWALDAIQVGIRARRELGDIEALMASIEANGFFQPMTISPEGLLILGWRRLEAARRLRLRTVNVWVRAGLSSKLQLLLAEQEDDVLHKPLTPTENATLYREVKQVMAEEATRRQETSRFGGAEIPGISGAANLAAPSGEARAQAAHLITGSNSYTTLERVGEVQRIADDEALPSSVRQLAVDALAGMDQDGKVNGRYQAVKDALRTRRQEELARMAEEALARVTTPGGAPKTRPIPSSTVPARLYRPRAFVVTWGELAGWSRHYDPVDVAAALTPDQWDMFEEVLAETLAFAEIARAARAHATA